MLIAAILAIASAKVAVGVDSDGSLFSLESNSKDADSLVEEIKDMDSTQLKEKVGVLLAELRQKNSLIDELSSALEKERQTTEGKRDTVSADSKISAGDMDDTVGLAAKNCSAAQAKLDEAHAAFDECLIFSMLP